MKRMTLGVAGTTLTFPKFGRKVRISAIHVVACSVNVSLEILNGAGVTAVAFFLGATTSATFANAVSITNTDLAQIPDDLWIDETDDVRLTFAGPTTSEIVVSYEEEKGQ